MKGRWVFIALIGLAFLVSPANALGKRCDKLNVFVVTSFEVYPFPPSGGGRMNITMAGTFSENAYVNDTSIKTTYNAQKTPTDYFNIKENYYYGQIYTFNYTLTAGTLKGLYISQVQLERKQDSPISCWEFSYHID